MPINTGNETVGEEEHNWRGRNGHSDVPSRSALYGEIYSDREYQGPAQQGRTKECLDVLGYETSMILDESRRIPVVENDPSELQKQYDRDDRTDNPSQVLNSIFRFRRRVFQIRTSFQVVFSDAAESEIDSTAARRERIRKVARTRLV